MARLTCFEEASHELRNFVPKRLQIMLAVNNSIARDDDSQQTSARANTAGTENATRHQMPAGCLKDETVRERENKVSNSPYFPFDGQWEIHKAAPAKALATLCRLLGVDAIRFVRITPVKRTEYKYN